MHHLQAWLQVQTLEEQFGNTASTMLASLR